MLISILLCSFTAVFGQQDEWHLAKDKNGIKVYTRQVQGTKIKEYRAITSIDAPPEKLQALLYNTEKYKQWMAGLKEAKTIRWEGDSVYYTWTSLAIPWPFHDRDEVTRSVIVKDSIQGSYMVKSTIIKGIVPEKEGLVRMTKGHGHWLLQKLPDGKTKVEFQFLADPAGNLPASIVNMFIVDSPYKTLMGLKKVTGNL